MTLTVGSDQYQLDFGLCLRRIESLAARSSARCSLKTFTGFVAAGGGGENKGGWGMTLGACFEKSSLGKRVEDVAADIPFFLTQAVAAPKGRTDNRKKSGRLLQQHLGREGGSGVCVLVSFLSNRNLCKRMQRRQSSSIYWLWHFGGRADTTASPTKINHNFMGRNGACSSSSSSTTVPVSPLLTFQLGGRQRRGEKVKRENARSILK